MKKPSEEHTSWISRLIPTVIARFFFFVLIVGCLDLDAEGNKTFISLHMNVEDGISFCACLYWLFDERPLIGLQLLPYPMGYILWIPAYDEPDDEDDDPDLPTPNGTA